MPFLDGFLVDLIDGPDDAVLVTGSRDGATWTGLDASLAPRWRIERSRHLPLFRRMFVEEGVLRRIETGGAIASLARLSELDGAAGPGRILAELDDGFVVARGQRILRVDCDGRPAWPDARTLPGIATRALVSGDRLLVTTDSLKYTAWGYLGPAVLMRALDGTVVAELRGNQLAALNGERFLLGLEGYDLFDTWLHDRDGKLVQAWRSCGHIVSDPDGTARVIELDRASPTRSHVVRLHPDGAIEHGPALDEGNASPPTVLDDGTIVFVDRGRLRAVDRQLSGALLADLLPIAPKDSWLHHARVARAGDMLITVVCERLPESSQPQCPGRTAGDMLYRCHLYSTVGPRSNSSGFDDA